MSRVETIRQRVSEKILPSFENIDGLRASCLAETALLPDSSLKLCNGMKVLPKNKSWIDGTYGIKKIDVHTGEQVAVCGFDIEKNEMIIRHTPQGKNPQEFSSRQVRNRFGRSDFRIEMMQAMIEIAKKLNLKGVIGFPIKPYYFGDMDTYLHKIKAKNKMFELFNFSFINKKQPNESYYYLALSSLIEGD